MTPKDAVIYLTTQCQLSQSDVAKLIVGKGVPATQATVSRIATGAFANPRYELGNAIIEIAKSAKPPIAQSQ